MYVRRPPFYCETKSFLEEDLKISRKADSQRIHTHKVIREF